jgi:hypothetical protein
MNCRAIGGLPSLEISEIAADVTMPVAKGKLLVKLERRIGAAKSATCCSRVSLAFNPGYRP